MLIILLGFGNKDDDKYDTGDNVEDDKTNGEEYNYW